jgi:phosphate transport system permease protein
VLIVVCAAVVAVPRGVLTALFLTEFAGPRSRVGQLLKLALDLMQGLPTIVIGLLVFSLLVIPTHTESGFAASIALAIIMLPLIARSSQEVLLLVPNAMREAADALGVPRWRSILTVIVPAAVGGIVTGSILAIARAARETAPLLLCDSLFNTGSTTLNIFGHGMPNIPMLIYNAADLGSPEAFTRAWGAALVLLAMILIANIGARMLSARSQAKLGR